VVLTGMGYDGTEGIRNMKQNGKCFCITQDEATSVVYGMPASVYKAGLSDLSLSNDYIPIKVNELARTKSAMSSKASS
jgi:two-component system chemotaxis response regulator CheB